MSKYMSEMSTGNSLANYQTVSVGISDNRKTPRSFYYVFYVAFIKPLNNSYFRDDIFIHFQFNFV